MKSNYVLSIIELSSSSSKEIEHKPGVGLLFLTSHRIVILLLAYRNKNWDLEIRNLEEPVNVAYDSLLSSNKPANGQTVLSYSISVLLDSSAMLSAA